MAKATSEETPVKETNELDMNATIEELESGTSEGKNTDEAPMPDSDVEEDEDVVRAAAENLDDDADHPPVKQVKLPSNRRKKVIMILLVLLLLGGGAAAAWYFFFRDTASDQPPASAPVQEETVSQNTNTPDAVIYAYRENENSPDTLYWRPAEGGDRTEITKLGRDEFLTHYDVEKNVVAYATDKGIFLSSDGGRSFNEILSLEQAASDQLGDQITSLKLSNEANRLAYGLAPSEGKSTIQSVNLEGQDKKELLESDKKGLFILKWSDEKQKMVYWKGCYNCDGNTIDPVMRDLAKGEEKQIDKTLKNTVYDSGLAISDDLSTMVVAQGTPDDSANVGIGITLTAPYSVSSIDLESLKKIELATVGQAGEKNPNGTTKYRSVLTGFVGNSTTAYYSDDESIYSLEGGDSPALLFAAKQDILYVPFINEDEYIVGFGESSNDYQLAHYSTDTKKTVQVFLGDDNTAILGVTTK